MTIPSQPTRPTVLSDRRWLIGIGISIAFGLFGAVMALLSYADRDKPQAPLGAPRATAAATTASPPPGGGPGAEPRGRGRGRGKD
jgi:hypothetical protein